MGEHLEIAWVNATKAILHGNAGGQSVEIVLTDAQRELVWGLNEKHERETERLLRSFLPEEDEA